MLLPTAKPPSAAVEAWVRGFEAGWRDPRSADELVERFLPLIDPEIRMVQPQIPDLVGHEEFRRLFAEPLFAMIPDLHGTVSGWAADGDVIFIGLVLEGTVGGQPVTMETVDRITLRDGLAIERVAFLDPAPLLRAVLTRPRSWPRFARVQARQIRSLTHKRRKR
jgi:hypothetical protein